MSLPLIPIQRFLPLPHQQPAKRKSIPFKHESRPPYLPSFLLNSFYSILPTDYPSQGASNSIIKFVTPFNPSIELHHRPIIHSSV